MPVVIEIDTQLRAGVLTATVLDILTSFLEETLVVLDVGDDLTVAIATRPDLMFGLARAWEGLVTATGWKTMAFRSRTEAKQWLDAVQSKGDTV